MDTATKTFLLEQFESIRAEMVTKEDFNREVRSIREDIESLAEMTSRSFTTVALDFTRLEAQIHSLEERVDTFVDIDYRGQIDVLRDEVRVIKTRLGIA